MVKIMGNAYSNLSTEELLKKIDALESENRYLKDSNEKFKGQLADFELLRYAINHAEENIYVVDLSGEILFCNDTFKKNIPAYSDDKKIWELKSYYGEKPTWDNFVNSLPQDGTPFKDGYTTKENEKTQYFEFYSYYVKRENKTPLVWTFSRNVTSRAKYEEKISNLNYLMDAILNNIPVYVFVKDPQNDFRYLYWNKAFEKHSGISANKVLGFNDFEIFPNVEDAKKFRLDDMRLMENGTIDRFEEDYVSITGDKRVVDTLKTLAPPGKKHKFLIGISWDITNVKQTQYELIAARNKAEESDRLKSAFLANMSHEIRTPLNAIVGFSRLLSETDEVEDKIQFADIIDANADLLLQLINDILDISKIEAGTLDYIPKEIFLDEFCSNIYDIYQPKMHDNVQLILENNHHQAALYCDPNRLMQVMNNLITNAIKFTSKGEIRFGYKIVDGGVQISVKDNGSGISKENLPRIFERFVKLDAFMQGTGLGLPICQTIVEKAGGSITVESEEGQGTTFFINFPASILISSNN